MDREFIEAYWEFKRLSTGDRSQRLASDALLWTHESLQAEIEKSPVEAVTSVVALADAAPDDEMSLVYLGTGPLEDLLSRPAPGVVDAVDAAARRNPRFRVALSHAAIVDPAAERLLRYQQQRDNN